jgi:hypothetical protein
MKIIGIITTTLSAAIAAVAAVVVVKSMPDIRRYLKMRSM